MTLLCDRGNVRSRSDGIDPATSTGRPVLDPVVIARTAAEVFQYVADLRNEPNWHVDIATVPAETTRRVWADFAGLLPGITYTVEPAGEGARFTRGVEMRPSRLKVLMTSMMAIMVPRRNKVFVQNLKRAMES